MLHSLKIIFYGAVLTALSIGCVFNETSAPAGKTTSLLLRNTGAGNDDEAPSVETSNELFSIGDIDNGRLLSVEADNLNGVELSYGMSVRLGTTTVYSVTGATIRGSATGLVFGLPPLKNDGRAVDATRDAFTYAEYVENQGITIEVSDMTRKISDDVDEEVVVSSKTITMNTAPKGNLYTWRDLQNMRFDLSGDYVVQNDIEFPEMGTDGFPSAGFKPVGTYEYLATAQNAVKYDPEKVFRGSLDGQNKEIRNFSIYNNRVENFGGLFGYIGYSKSTKTKFIRNVYFVNPMVVYTISFTPNIPPKYYPLSLGQEGEEGLESSYIGVLAGGISGVAGLGSKDAADTSIEIQHVHVSYTKDFANPNLYAITRNSRVVSGKKVVGSLVGLAHEGVTIRLSNTRDYNIFLRAREKAGGLVGALVDSRIIVDAATVITGSAVVDRKDGGGVAGLMTYHSYIGSTDSTKKLTSSVTVLGGETTGGIGGFVGNIADRSVLHYAHLMGGSSISTKLIVQGYVAVGGIVGLMTHSDPSSSARWSSSDFVTVSGYGDIGGYIGRAADMSSGAISIVSRNTKLSVESFRNRAGGLIGGLTGVDLTDSYFNGSVRVVHPNGSYTASIGGLVGAVHRSSTGSPVSIARSGVSHENAGTIADVNALKTIQLGGGEYAADTVGGLVGVTGGDITFKEVYFNGNAYGKNVGAILGRAIGADLEFEDIRVAGKLVATGHGGGLVGVLDSTDANQASLDITRAVIELGPGAIASYTTGMSYARLNLVLGILTRSTNNPYTASQVYYLDTLSLSDFPAVTSDYAITTREGVAAATAMLSVADLGEKWMALAGRMPVLKNVAEKEKQY